MAWLKHSKLQREHLFQAKSEIHLAVQLFCYPPNLNLPNVTVDPSERIAWNQERKSFDSIFFGDKFNVQISIDVAAFKLKVMVEEISFDEISLYKKSVGELLKWVTDRFAKLKIESDYFIEHAEALFPSLEFGQEERFDFYRKDDFAELAKYYHNASYILSRLQVDLLNKKLKFSVYPENIYISTNFSIDEQRSITFGFSPGDDNFPEPYYFVKFFPEPSKSMIEDYSLPVGNWYYEEWTGLFLTANSIIKEQEDLEENIVFDFLKNAVEISSRIMVT